MAPIPPVTGVLETCLYVGDVVPGRAFYERIFGFTALTADDRIVAFDEAPGSVLILFRRGDTREPIATAGGVIPPHGGSGEQHCAFGIAEAIEALRAESGAGSRIARWAFRLRQGFGGRVGPRGPG